MPHAWRAPSEHENSSLPLTLPLSPAGRGRGEGAIFYIIGRSNNMEISPDDLNENESYKLMAGIIVPRPIAWVSTISKKGIFNAAPFSFFTGISTKPPTIGFSIGLRRGRKKDTLKNIEYTRDFVINIVEENLALKMNITAVDFPSRISEIIEAGLTPLPSEKVKSPRIAESPINLECRLLRIIKLGISRHRFIIGEVVQYHIRDGLISDEFKIDFSRLNVLGRLAGSLYCRINDFIEIPRLNYEQYKIDSKKQGKT